MNRGRMVVHTNDDIATMGAANIDAEIDNWLDGPPRRRVTVRTDSLISWPTPATTATGWLVDDDLFYPDDYDDDDDDDDDDEFISGMYMFRYGITDEERFPTGDSDIASGSGLMQD